MPMRGHPWEDGPRGGCYWKILTMLLSKSQYLLAYLEIWSVGPGHIKFWKASLLWTNRLDPNFLGTNNQIWPTVFLHFLPVRCCSSFPLNSQFPLRSSGGSWIFLPWFTEDVSSSIEQTRSLFSSRIWLTSSH